jgi:steroid delta-isomerase-like uncharacterized protein
MRAIVASLVPVALAACGSSPAPATAPATAPAKLATASASDDSAPSAEAQALAVVAAWNRAAAARDAAALIDLYAEDAVVIPASSGMKVKGGENIVEKFFRPFWSAFPDLVSDEVVELAAGDTVISMARTRGSHQGPMMGMPPTGKKTSFYGLAVVQIEGGKIARQLLYADNLNFLGQLGAYPGRHRGYEENPLETAPDQLAGSSEDEPANVALVRGHLEALGRHQAAAVLEGYAADALMSNQSLPVDVRGADAIGLEIRRQLGAFSDLAIEIEGVWAAGDWVAATYVLSGTHNGPWGDIKPTGKPIRLEAADLYRIEGGKIAEHWIFVDGMMLLAQMGKLPAGP